MEKKKSKFLTDIQRLTKGVHEGLKEIETTLTEPVQDLAPEGHPKEDDQAA